MSEPLVTQCPACRTRFKLSRSQLDSANGAVRCGACLEVFAGADCLIDQPDQAPFFPAEDALTRRQSNRESDRPVEESDPLVTADSDDDSFTDWYHGTEILYSFVDDDSDDPTSGGNSEPKVVPAEAAENLNDLSMQSLSQSIDSISQAIVELPATNRRLRYYLVYGFLNLLLLCLLGGQYLWFNKNQLAAHEDFRSYYVKVCQLMEPTIACNLPDYVNLSQISTRKLIVRSHPAIRNALIIDAIILNSAAFAQPFPKLELKFTDLDFNTVASRRFEANEYLGGELTGLKFIPARTEVRVSLEIVDPGDKAVSYELYAVHP